MLNIQFISWTYKKHIKTGLYLDYLTRLCGKSGVLNLFIWASLYVSEKFAIEYCTRYVSNHHKQLFNTTSEPLSVFKLTASWVFILALLVCIA
jgi:hypothetical protein